MLLEPKKDKLAQLIVSRSKPGDFKKSDEAGEGIVGERKEEMLVNKDVPSDSSVALDSAAAKMLKAFHANDPQTIVGAVRDMFTILNSEEDRLEPFGME